MPTAPKKIKRSWVKEYKAHERVKDMRWFYNSWSWRKYSRSYKERHPLCCDCEAEGIATASEVTDHIQTYEQCPEAFDLNNLNDKYMKPRCKKHHDSKSGKQAHGFKEK